MALRLSKTCSVRMSQTASSSSADNPGSEAWRCFMAEYTAPHITTPTFALQSAYDAWQLPNVRAVTCGFDVKDCSPAQKAAFLGFRDKMLAKMAAALAVRRLGCGWTRVCCTGSRTFMATGTQSRSTASRPARHSGTGTPTFDPPQKETGPDHFFLGWFCPALRFAVVVGSRGPVMDFSRISQTHRAWRCVTCPP